MNNFLRLFLRFLIALIVIITLHFAYLFYKKGNLSWSAYFSRQEPRYLVFKQDYPLIAAAHEGDINKVKALLEAGVDPNQTRFKVIPKRKELKGTESAAQIVQEAIKPIFTGEMIAVKADWPLNAAVNNNHPEIVRLLLEKGADVNLKDLVDKTALDWAKENQRTEIIKMLEDAQQKQAAAAKQK